MEKIERCFFCDSVDLEHRKDADWPPMIWCNYCQEWVETYEDTDQLQKPDKVINS